MTLVNNRSAIFFHDEKQKAIAEKSKQDLEQAGLYKDPIVTEITPFENFYIAEDYHKNYYDKQSRSSLLQFCDRPQNPQAA